MRYGMVEGVSFRWAVAELKTWYLWWKWRQWEGRAVGVYVCMWPTCTLYKEQNIKVMLNFLFLRKIESSNHNSKQYLRWPLDACTIYQTILISKIIFQCTSKCMLNCYINETAATKEFEIYRLSKQKSFQQICAT